MVTWVVKGTFQIQVIFLILHKLLPRKSQQYFLFYQEKNQTIQTLKTEITTKEQELKTTFQDKEQKMLQLKIDLEELKANQPATVKVLSKDELLAESNDFYAYDAKWQKDGKLTDDFYEDMKLANKYAQDSGYSQEEINGMDRSHYFKTLIDAARWKKYNSKAKATKKKILKTPKSGKTKVKSESLSAEEIFYGKK